MSHFWKLDHWAKQDWTIKYKIINLFNKMVRRVYSTFNKTKKIVKLIHTSYDS